MRIFSIFGVVVLSLFTSATVETQVANLPPAQAPASELASLVERYNVDRSALLRRYDVEYSPERYARVTRFFRDWQQDLAGMAFDTWVAKVGSTTPCCARDSTTS
ncbi:MAG: hypothetical protein ACRD2N_08230 [Vicinamibacterales bacterium]